MGKTTRTKEVIVTVIGAIVTTIAVAVAKAKRAVIPAVFVAVIGAAGLTTYIILTNRILSRTK